MKPDTGDAAFRRRRMNGHAHWDSTHLDRLENGPEKIEMTEYEIADIAASVLGNFLTSLTVFLSIVSAYVISAFAVGERLSGVQLFIVNACFLIATAILGFFVVALFRRFFELVQSIDVAKGIIGDIDFTWALCVLLLAIILGSLFFMWNVRTEGTEQDGSSG